MRITDGEGGGAYLGGVHVDLDAGCGCLIWEEHLTRCALVPPTEGLVQAGPVEWWTAVEEEEKRCA